MHQSRRLIRFNWQWMFIVFVAIVLLSGIVLQFIPLSADISHRTLNVSGLTRQYRLVVPHTTREQSDVPLVIALHGALDRTEEMAHYTDLDSLAVEQEFVLVYLQGRHLNWPPNIPAENPDHIVPDLEFFRAVCDVMTSDWSCDSNRIYVVGVSQGGAMANLLTAKCSERIAASVCNCGWLPEPLGETELNTVNKCAMLFISGTGDTQVSPELTRAAHDAFARSGHPVTFVSLTGKGHGWNGVNEILWDFLKDRSLAP